MGLAREIGSDFELPDASVMSDGGHLGRWLDGGQPVLGGRQALGMVAQELAGQGVSEILVPDHYCESMTAPFARHGVRPITVATTDDCLLAPAGLATHLRRHPQAAVLHCETFGTAASDDLQAVLTAARDQEHRVVVDRTHSFLAPRATSGDYEVTSLRKLLPIPVGASVVGVANRPVTCDDGTHVAKAKAAAQQMKSDYLAGRRSDKAHLGALAEAEDRLDSVGDGCALPADVCSTLDRLDPDAILARRHANARFVVDAVDRLGIAVVNRDGVHRSPCWVVISVPNVQELRGSLIRESIFLPILWPAPSDAETWRRDVLCLVIDQRYDERDMERLVGCLSEHRG